MQLRRNLVIDFLYYRETAEFPLSCTPFISSLDPEEEYLTIYNPGPEPICLEKYFVVDSKHLHRFAFGKEDVVPACAQLHLYTCPGSHHTGHYASPHSLWTNNDGSLRKKEVLNNEHCTMQLHAPNGKCIATITANKDEPPRIARRGEELVERPLWQLRPPQRLRLTLLRGLVLLAMLAAAFLRHEKFVFCYWAAVLLDVVVRSHEEEKGEPSPLQDLLEGLSDRLHIFSLYVAALHALSTQYSLSSVVIFGVVLLAGAGEGVCWGVEEIVRPKKHGHQHRKASEVDDLFHRLSVWLGGEDVTRPQHGYPSLLCSCICLGSELFLLLVYFQFNFLSVSHRGSLFFFETGAQSRGELLGGLRRVLPHDLAMLLAVLGFLCRQVNNAMRVRSRLLLDYIDHPPVPVPAPLPPASHPPVPEPSTFVSQKTPLPSASLPSVPSSASIAFKSPVRSPARSFEEVGKVETPYMATRSSTKTTRSRRSSLRG